MKYLGLDGQVTFLATGGPPETLAAMQFGKIQAGVFGLKSLGAAVVTTREWAREKPELVERYVRAAIKGAHRLKTDREFGMKVIGKYTKLSSAPLLGETYDYYKDQWLKDGVPSRDGLQKNIDIAAVDVPEAKNATPEQLWGKP